MTADDGRARDERRASRPADGRSTSGASTSGAFTSGASASGTSDRPARRPATGPSGAEFAGVGMQFGGTVALAALLGHWLDGKLGTNPWLLIVLVFVGASAAFYSIYRRVIRPGTPPVRSGRDA